MEEGVADSGAGRPARLRFPQRTESVHTAALGSPHLLRLTGSLSQPGAAAAGRPPVWQGRGGAVWRFHAQYGGKGDLTCWRLETKNNWRSHEESVPVQRKEELSIGPSQRGATPSGKMAASPRRCPQLRRVTHQLLLSPLRGLGGF